ncbi:MAG TPA: hypothetical protein VF121_06555 [Thermoanaerobaculia bacterium]|nr:hypothetical protein [Thermoanaerobaculia bacterium]
MARLTLRLDWQHCRYVACPASGIKGSFRELLDDLGCALPADLEPAELVRYGWIEPVLRIHLPESFYLSWENFPSLSMRGTIAEGDFWASHLWAIGARGKRGSAEVVTLTVLTVFPVPEKP